MTKQSIDSILDTFDPASEPTQSELKGGGAVTIWLPPQHKQDYDALQKVSGRKFSKTVRAILQATIERAKSKAS